MSPSRTLHIAAIGKQLDRRGFVAGLGRGALFLPLAGCASVGHASEAMKSDIVQLAERFSPRYPQFRIALEVVAEVGEAIEVGQGPKGGLRIVPITGGEFRGKGLSGRVLPGGADRQTIRNDGIRELDAIYELEADDGTVLMVRNQVIIDTEQPPDGESRYARSVVKVIAPKGPHDWLNRRVLLGTLDSLRPAEPRVFLRFYIFE